MGDDDLEEMLGTYPAEISEYERYLLSDGGGYDCRDRAPRIKVDHEWSVYATPCGIDTYHFVKGWRDECGECDLVWGNFWASTRQFVDNLHDMFRYPGGYVEECGFDGLDECIHMWTNEHKEDAADSPYKRREPLSFEADRDRWMEARAWLLRKLDEKAAAGAVRLILSGRNRYIRLNSVVKEPDPRLRAFYQTLKRHKFLKKGRPGAKPKKYFELRRKRKEENDG